MAEYHYVPVPEGSEMSSDPMHQALQGHMLTCDQCRYAVEKSGPKKLGDRSPMCAEYQQIVLWFAGGHEIGSS